MRVKKEESPQSGIIDRSLTISNQPSPSQAILINPVNSTRKSSGSEVDDASRALSPQLFQSEAVQQIGVHRPNFSDSNRRKRPLSPSFRTRTSTKVAKPMVESRQSSSCALPGSSSPSSSNGVRRSVLQQLLSPRASQQSAKHSFRGLDKDVPSSSNPGNSEYPSMSVGTSSRRSSVCSSSYDSLDDQDMLDIEAELNKNKFEPTKQEKPWDIAIKSEMQVENQAIVPSPRPIIAHTIRRIPESNLFVEDLPDGLQIFPYFILFICCRLSSLYGVSISKLMHGMHPQTVCSSSTTFWNELHERVDGKAAAPREGSDVWLASRNSFHGYSFKGKILLNDTQNRSAPVFKLELEAIKAENSCRFQRKFGSDRFLYLTAPAFNYSTMKPGRFTWKDMEQIEAYWAQWLRREHFFLGRTWKVFHIEPERKKQNRDESPGKRIVMFATEGVDIETISLRKMMYWFFPFKENQDQTFCKAFGRLDLGLSRTVPTITFKPSQIRRVPDIKSNDEPEDTQFDDPRCTSYDTGGQIRVMNDGCSLLSVGAALKIWERYRKDKKKNAPLPSAFQGRIGGAKGMWIISGEPHLRHEHHREIWIEISDSQLKFEPHWEDRDDNREYDPLRLTFECCGHSSPVRIADLHIAYIPILADRHVPWENIAKTMTKQLDEDREKLLSILTDANTDELYKWVDNIISGSRPKSGVRWQASLPVQLTEKILHLLRGGLRPTESPYLASQLSRFIGKQHTKMERSLRIPLGKSTYMYGITDPFGVLKPGQVYIRFSEPFVDEATGETFYVLHGWDVLVSRQPACQRHDIQKVQAVDCPELSHYTDVLVCATKGQFPLAGKLQGGDYDGDRFWICWEPTLVEAFQNAPAPVVPPNPADYGIKTEKRTVRDLMGLISVFDLANIDIFLDQAFHFRSQESKLGRVTVFLNDWAYMENGIHSKEYSLLCDIHDLLVDSMKQGYIYGDKDFNNFIHHRLSGVKPQTPPHRTAMEICRRAEDMRQREEHRETQFSFNPNNIIDYLYFEIVGRHNTATRQAVHMALPQDDDNNIVLKKLCHELQYQGSAVIKSELMKLIEKFGKLHKKWVDGLDNKKATSPGAFSSIAEACYREFCSILPSPENQNQPEIRIIQTHFFGPNTPTPWEMMRASALYTLYPRNPAFVWNMAGRYLTLLNNGSQDEWYSVCAPIFDMLRPMRPKVREAEEAQEKEEPLDDHMQYVSL